MLKKVAVIYGGNSEESDISKKSAEQVFNALSSMVEPCLIHIKGEKWTCEWNENTFEVNKNDFSVQTNEAVLRFDSVFNAIHGDPGENGKMAAYFEMIGLPHSSCGFDTASLTFSKWQCNQVLRSLGFQVSHSFVINIHDPHLKKKHLDALGFPFFLKPNKNGSSFGIAKIKSEKEIEPALQKIFEMDTEAIAEKLISGTEVTCAVYTKKGAVLALPLTEIVSKNEFFDYQAKYEGASDEITPARISDQQTSLVQQTSIEIYKKMALKGLVRIDYMIQDEIPTVIEINTVPGLSKESIVPKQLATAGISASEFFNDLVEEAMS